MHLSDQTMQDSMCSWKAVTSWHDIRVAVSVWSFYKALLIDIPHFTGYDIRVAVWLASLFPQFTGSFTVRSCCLVLYKHNCSIGSHLAGL